MKMDVKFCVWELKQIRREKNIISEKTVILPKGKTTIGRGLNNLMMCLSTMASRNHCEIKLLDSGLIFIKDLASLNGTFLGSSKIFSDREISLRNKDIIGIGVDTNDLSDGAWCNIFHLTQRLLEKDELDSRRYDNNVVPVNSLSSEGFNNSCHNFIGARSNNEINNATVLRLSSGSNISINPLSQSHTPQNNQGETIVNVLSENASNYCGVSNSIEPNSGTNVNILLRNETQDENNDNSHLRKHSTGENVTESSETNSLVISKNYVTSPVSDRGISDLCKPESTSCGEERSSDNKFVNNSVQIAHCSKEKSSNMKIGDTTEPKMCIVEDITGEFERNKGTMSTFSSLKICSDLPPESLISRLHQEDEAVQVISNDSNHSINHKLMAGSSSKNKNSKEEGISNATFTLIPDKSFSSVKCETFNKESALEINTTEKKGPKSNKNVNNYISADRTKEQHTSSLHATSNGSNLRMDNLVLDIFNRRLSNSSDLNENLEINAPNNSPSKNESSEKCPVVDITSPSHSSEQCNKTKEQKCETLYLSEIQDSATKVEPLVSESFTTDDDVITIDDDDESLLPCSQMFDVKFEEFESDLKESDTAIVDITDEDDLLSEADSSDEWFLRLSQCDTFNFESLSDDSNIKEEFEDECNEDIKIKIIQSNVIDSQFDCKEGLSNEDSGNQLPLQLQMGASGSSGHNKTKSENTKYVENNKVSKGDLILEPLHVGSKSLTSKEIHCDPPLVSDIDNMSLKSPRSKRKRKHGSDKLIHNKVMVHDQEDGHHLHSKKTRKSHVRKTESPIKESKISCKTTKDTEDPALKYFIVEMVENSNKWDENQRCTQGNNVKNNENIATNISSQTKEKNTIEKQEGVVGTKLFSNDIHLTSRESVEISKRSTEETNLLSKTSNFKSGKLKNHSDCSSKLNTDEITKLDAVQKKISAKYDKKPTPVIKTQFLPVKRKRVPSPNCELENKGEPQNEIEAHEPKLRLISSKKPSLLTDRKAERRSKLAEIANRTNRQEKRTKKTKDEKSIKRAIKNTHKSRTEMFIDQLAPNKNALKKEQSTDNNFKVPQNRSLSQYKIPRKTVKNYDNIESQTSITNEDSCSKQISENISEVNTSHFNKISESEKSIKTKLEVGLSNIQESNNCGMDKIFDSRMPHFGKAENTSNITESSSNRRSHFVVQCDQNTEEHRKKSVIGRLKSIMKKPNKESNLDNNVTNKKVHFHCEDEKLIVKTQYFEIEEGLSLKPTNGQKDTPPRRQYRSHDRQVSYVNYFEETLYTICKWNTVWFQEKNKCIGDPPVFTRQIYHMQDSFAGYIEYRRSIFPLMLYELWAGLARVHDLIQNKNNPFSIEIQKMSTKTITHSFFLTQQECKITNVCQLDCQILLEKSNISLWPRLSDLVVLHTRCIDLIGKKLKKRVLGLVIRCNTRPISSHTAVSQKLKEKSVNATMVMDLTIFITVDRYKIDYKQESRIAVLKNIKPDMRLFNALDCLSTSPMLNIICQPCKNNLDIPQMLHINGGKYPVIAHLNQSQKNAAINVANACLSNTDMIHFVHGPPGCGKSEVIISIIQMVFMAYVNKEVTERPKILLCAPSNAAIDDIFMRLMECREKFSESYKDQKLKMVRIGRTDFTHKNVKSMTLDFLVEKDLKKSKDMFGDEQYRMIELKNLEAKKIQLNNQLANLNKNDDRYKRNVEMTLAKTIKSMKELEKGEIEKAWEGKELREKKKERELVVLERANVIASTLSSCYNPQMEAAHLSKKLKVTCCIVDEATQCSEPEVLIPLMMGVRQLVLVGDPLQLPATVLSETAKEHGFARSMFARHRDWWLKQTPGELPKSRYHFLDTQYRMHPDIAKWPSEYFYGSSLKTHSSLEARSSSHPLHPYVILSHTFTQSNHEECNYGEATLVERLVESINSSGLCKNRTIGIITPYSQQRALLKGKLHNIEVGTIDSFQGQERDIIILSCVRTEGVGFLSGNQRLNVALTRARYTLIICGNFKSLQIDSSWGSLLQNAFVRGTLKTVDKFYTSDDLLHAISKTLQI